VNAGLDSQEGLEYAGFRFVELISLSNDNWQLGDWSSGVVGVALLNAVININVLTVQSNKATKTFPAGRGTLVSAFCLSPGPGLK
jgi:hypothetical protein